MRLGTEVDGLAQGIGCTLAASFLGSRCARIRFLARIVTSVAVLAGILQPGQVLAESPPDDPPEAHAASQPASLLDQIHVDDCSRYSDRDLITAKAARDLFRGARDIYGEARALTILGDLYNRAGEYTTALPFLTKAISLLQNAPNLDLKARILTILGDTYNHLGEPQNALRVLSDALAIASQSHDNSAAALIITTIGEVHAVNDPRGAMKEFEKAYELNDDTHELKTKAIILNDEGSIYDSTDPERAFERYQQALLIEDQINDCRDKAATLANIATHYEDRGEARKALESYAQALQLERQLQDRSAEARVLHGMAYFYDDMGNTNKALSLYKQALDMESQTGDVAAKGATLREIAGIQKELGKPTVALRLYLECLSLFKQSKDTQSQVFVLNNLGAVQADLRHPKEARAYYVHAIKLAATIGDAVTPAYSAWGIGSLDESDALPSYFRALRLAREFDRPELEGNVDSSLMEHFRRNEQSGVAIFFGKQAIDRFQLIRRSMTGLESGLVGSFLQSNAHTYRVLAELLIDEGRLTEAQQILDLLKIQEYSDYVRGNARELTANPTRTSKEAEFEATYQEETSNIVALEKQLRGFDAEHRSSEDPDYVRLREKLDKADDDFNAYLRDIASELNRSNANRNYFTVLQETSMLQDAIARRPNTVALYTLLADDRYRIILITDRRKIWRSYQISGKALAKKCQQYFEIISNRQSSPEKIAQELFTIVFGPVKKDVEQTGATTLVWSLDGALRYVPVAALLDPSTGRYLIDSYSIANYAPFNFYLTDEPHISNATAIAMGTSRNYEEALGPLPNVRNELDQIVKDPAVPDSHGLIPGTILLDNAFTQTAMEKDITTQSIVHIASHFVLTAGNDDLSYLLMGGKDQDSLGFHLSVSAFRHDYKLDLRGKELITLSACRTAAANQTADGFVMEGVSDAVLEKKAKAVISTLWEVNDLSTGAFMADFYHLWIESNGELTKAEALRQTELDLLHGKIMPKPNLAHPDTPASFTHPYYWAPFLLMGNWR